MHERLLQWYRIYWVSQRWRPSLLTNCVPLDLKVDEIVDKSLLPNAILASAAAINAIAFILMCVITAYSY
jgi:hypothetical protein